MIRVVKYLILVVLFLESVVFFLPKQNLYYFILEQFKQNHIEVQTKHIDDKGFRFLLDDTILFYDGLEAINIQTIDTASYLFSSNIHIVNLKIDQSLKQFLPSKIRYIHIQHNILHPLVVDIKIDMTQAHGYGTFDLRTKKIVIVFKTSKQFVKQYGKLLQKAKRLKNGEYQIEYKL